jgi:predicted enzyme related to lactoylglutathione lyase
MLDAQGGMFAIMQPTLDGNAPAETEPGVGEASWHELYADDAAAAMTFYSGVFGWNESGVHDMGPMGKYYMFGRSFALGGMMTKTGDMKPLPTAWTVYFRVPDVDAAAEKVKTLGGKVLNGPMEVPGGDRIVNCLDPQGAAFSLHQRK